MIQHLFKLTWKKRKRHLLLVVELFFAYLATAFLTLFLWGYSITDSNNQRFSIDNLVEITAPGISDTARQSLQALKDVENLTFTNLSPYNNSIRNDTLFRSNDTIGVFKWQVDDRFARVMKLSMDEGRWFLKNDSLEAKKPLIITTTLKHRLFQDQPALGKLIRVGQEEYKILGVVKDLNDPSGDYRDRPHLFTFGGGNLFLVRLKQPVNNQVSARLKGALSPYIPGFSVKITPVEQIKHQHYREKGALLFFFGGLCVFLIINVILGLFSILYQNINSRKSEIGLRKASGATNNQIYSQFIIEVASLTTIAIIPGIIIAYQFALFEVIGPNGNYYYAIVCGALIIYVIATLCALYPAWLASKIQPAIALHEE
jgi:putative ABC transport system permease protein